MNLFSRHKKFEAGLQQQLSDMEVKPSELLWENIDAQLSKDGFESDLRSKLENFELMPHTETWNNIATEIPTEKAYTKFGNYLWSGLLLLLFSIVFYFYHDKSQSNNIALMQLPPIEVENNNSIAKESSPIEEQKSIASQQSKPQIIAEKKKASNPKIKTPGQKVFVTQNVEQPLSIVNPITNKVKSTSVNQKQLETEISTAPINQPITNIESNKQKDQLVAKENKIERQVPQTLPLAVATEMPTSHGNKNGVVPATDSKPVENDQAKAIENGTGSIQPKEVIEAVTVTPTNLPKDLSADENALSKFSMSIYAGAMMCYTTYKQPSQSSLDFTENIAFRKMLERPSLDWSGGFVLDYNINNKWMISSGLMMLNFSQNFSYQTSTAVTPANPNEVGAAVYNPTDSIEMGNSNSGRIKFSWTEIPIFINYNIKRGYRWNLDLQTGVSYAIVNTINGGMVSYDNKGLLLLQDKNSFPNISNSFFATVMPQVSYSFGESVSLGLVPTFKYSLTSIVGNERWIQQHPYFIGVTVCLRKRF